MGRAGLRDRLASEVLAAGGLPGWRMLAREALGTGLISAGLIGAAVMAARVPGADPLGVRLAVALFMGAALGLAIFAFGAGLRAHFNPALSFAMMLRARSGPIEAGARMAAQCVGALAGVVLAHAMLDMGGVQTGAAPAGGFAIWLGEVFAAWLIVVVMLGGQGRATPLLALWAGAALALAGFITISLASANPALSLARTITGSAVGIAPEALAGMVICQFIGAALAALTLAIMNKDASAGEQPGRGDDQGR